MSSSIDIPTASSSGVARGLEHDYVRHHHHRHHLRSLDAGVGSSSDAPSSAAMSPSSSTSSHSPTSSLGSSPAFSAARSHSVDSFALSESVPSPTSVRRMHMGHQRRPSLLSSAISKQITQVINISPPDAPPRLISYLSSGQGFTWNPEIFVPSYIDHEYTPLENQREPVHEIFLTDEEAASIFPK